MIIMLKGKVTVIGAGFVGSTIAYTMMLSGLVSEVVLLDISKDKAEGDALDLNHGKSLISPVKITGGDDYSNITGSDMLIITAGVGQRPGESRIDLLKRNVSVFEHILNKALNTMSTATIHTFRVIFKHKRNNIHVYLHECCFVFYIICTQCCIPVTRFYQLLQI